MPKYIRPAISDFAEDPIYALGNILRASIIGYLRREGPSKRGEIAEALEAKPNTVSAAIRTLIEAGVLLTDPEHPVAGSQVRYSVNEAVVGEMWITLGQAIGEL